MSTVEWPSFSCTQFHLSHPLLKIPVVKIDLSYLFYDSILKIFSWESQAKAKGTFKTTSLVPTIRCSFQNNFTVLFLTYIRISTFPNIFRFFRSILRLFKDFQYQKAEILQENFWKSIGIIKNVVFQPYSAYKRNHFDILGRVLNFYMMTFWNIFSFTKN